MGAIHELRLRSNKFVAELEVIIEAGITDNKGLATLNREQLKDHKNVADQTITPPYSLAYAKKKGFKDPDIFVTGGIHNSLVIEARDNKYWIYGKSPFAKYFPEKYGDIYGIAPSKFDRAKAITSRIILAEYKQRVLTK